MTPTEAAAVAVIVAAIAALFYEGLRREDVLESIRRTAMLKGSIFMILSAIAAFGHLASLERVPQAISSLITDLGLGPIGFMPAMNALFIFAGMFLDIAMALALIVPLGYRVSDPERYGVVDFDTDGAVQAIIEKPPVPPSNYAVTGLYFVDGSAPERARAVEPSARGELEITTLLESYLHDGALQVKRMGRGYAWLDTGTHASLLDAGNFVRTLTERQGQQVGSPDEVAFEMGFIDREQLKERAVKFGKNDYGSYLEAIADKRN